MEALFGCNPALLKSLSVTDLVENTITYKVITNNLLTSKQQKVHLIVNIEFLDVRSCNYNVRVTAKLFSLCLDVSKGTRD